MKCLLLLSLTASIFSPLAADAGLFGKYNSLLEAGEACDNWAAKAGKFKVVVQKLLDTLGPPSEMPIRQNLTRQQYLAEKFFREAEEHDRKQATKTINMRDCLFEQETRQILGFSNEGFKANQTYSPEEYKNRLRQKINKYFRY